MGVTWDDKIQMGPPLPVADGAAVVVAPTAQDGDAVVAPLVTPAPVPTLPKATATANPTSLSPPATPPTYRNRSVSNVSTATSTTDSIASTASSVPSKRQRDFETLFGPQLRPRRLTERPVDFLTVLQTQSADLQASVLLHGRLYLTSYHLCFRSNIVGYITEKIYPLSEVVKVERSTTAKWIQNAVSVTFVNEQGEDEVVGYGSMGDREAMYEMLMDTWKERAPERHAAFIKKEENAKAAEAEEERKASTNTVRPTEAELADKPASDKDKADGAGDEGEAEGGRPKSKSEVKHSEESGEGYEKEALDTKIPIPMDQLFNLLYHNKEFHMDFLKNKQKLTDIDVSEWADVGGSKERKMTYVMHMNNRIGPKKSDCNGLERIEKEDPDKAYEIVSETQTPDIPSGKSFKIRTRTCLSHTGLDNDETPATRLHCTTQCDWSASSMLKSTITPAVIKGQKEYHQALLSAVKEWIKAHPEDFEAQPSAEAGQEDGSAPVPSGEKGAAPGEKGADAGAGAGGEVMTETKGTVEQLTEIPANQAMSWITILCALSLALNMYLLGRTC